MSMLVNPFRFGGAAAPAYDPATLFPSNGYWFDASDMSKLGGVSTVGNTVTSWADSSGNGHTLSPAGTSNPWAHPDGYAVQFSGGSTSRFGPVSYTAIAQPYYFAIGYARLDVSTTQTRNLTRGFPTVQFNENNSTHAGQYHFSSGTNAYVSGGNNTLRHVVFMKVNGASSQIWINGTSVFTGDLGTSASSALYLGGISTETANNFYGYVYQVLLSDNAQMLTDRTSIEAYINSKMGL